MGASSRSKIFLSGSITPLCSEYSLLLGAVDGELRLLEVSGVDVNEVVLSTAVTAPAPTACLESLALRLSFLRA